MCPFLLSFGRMKVDTNPVTYTSNNPVNYVDPTGHSLIAAALSGIAWAASILVAVTTFKVVETVVEQTVEYVANNPKAKAGISAMAGASLGITLPKMMEELQEVYEQEYTGSSLGKILDLSSQAKIGIFR